MRQTVKFFLLMLPVVCLVACLKWPDPRVSDSSPHHYQLSDALKQENVVPVAIIGSGPAGLTAALYVARAGMKAFVFAGPSPRGQLIETTYIDNWPARAHVLGSELMEDMEKQAVSFGTTIIHDTVTKIDCDSWPFSLQTEDGRKFKAMSLIIATGATPRRLNIPGEQEHFGKGVTTCAICDAPHFKGKEVVIAGGGDSAAEMVFELAPYVKKVTIMVRKDTMRAAAAIQKRLLEYPNVSIEYHKEITQIYGNGDQVSAIDVYDNKIKETQRRSIDGVFLAVGHDPNNKLLQGNVDLDEHGYMVMQGRTQESSVPGVFAAGEIQDPSYRQAIVASGEGAKAALDATSFLYDLGFSTEIGLQLDKKFFENFSDVKLELQEIFTEKEFNDLIWKSKGLVVLDFFSTECPVCVRLLPVLEAVAQKLQGRAVFLKTNFDKVRNEIWKPLWHDREIKVRHLPSLLIFKDGKFLEMNTNFMSKTELLEYLQKFL